MSPCKWTVSGLLLLVLFLPACDKKSPPAEVQPFNGRDLTGWKFDDTARPNGWKVGRAEVVPDNTAALQVVGAGTELVNSTGEMVNPYTERLFGDARIQLEALLPSGSNSGMYVMGEYELQMAYSPTTNINKPGNMDFGALTRVAAPKVYAAKDPGQWQSFDVEFRAPRFDPSGKKTAPARFVSVRLNGKLIHENVDFPEPTLGGLTGEDQPRGPLLLQGNHGPVAFRNIVVTPRP